MKKETIIYLVIAAVIITGYFIYTDSKTKDSGFFTDTTKTTDANEVILASLTKPIYGMEGLAKLVDQKRRRSDYNQLEILQVKIKRTFNLVKTFTLHSKEYYTKIINDVQYILDNKKPV
jgi:hypothetical protein